MTTTWARTSLRSCRDERGIALPLALILMLSMTALALAFSVLASTEPTIAANLSKTSQARALAESGIERAAWALSNPSAANGIPSAQIPALSPYDGTSFFTVNSAVGGFTVRVTAGSTSSERAITSVGWSPSNTAPNKGHRKIQVMLQASTSGVRFLDPPCALCVAGQVQAGGNATIDSRSNGCGGGAAPTTAIQASGGVSIGGSADVYGSGNSTRNEAGVDYNPAVSAAATSAFKYTAAELLQLKAIAQANGTYYQGARSSLPAGGGVVFIDTLDGTPYSASTSDSNAGSLSLSGNNTFSGIVIVSGSVNISGTNTLNGLIYALNDLTITGNATVNGAIASENRKDTSSTNIDTSATGSVVINYHCDNVRTAGGTVTPTWTVVPQTYREIEGS